MAQAVLKELVEILNSSSNDQTDPVVVADGIDA